MAVSRICSVEGCCKLIKARGWCNAHHRRWMRHGDPLKGATAQGDPMRFIEAVLAADAAHGCVTWPYATLPTGYGHLWVDGANILASRYVCERVNGKPPTPEHDAAHSCGRGDHGCISPLHLSWKTRSENESDKIDHGTIVRGEKSHFSKLTEQNVRDILALKGLMTGRDVGEIFSMTRWAVYKIWSGRNWSWLNPKDISTPL